MGQVFFGECTVLENRAIAADTYILSFEASKLVKNCRPGQFVMVRTGQAPEKGAGPLLKRPFSIHRLGPDNQISLLYRVVGVGTRLLTIIEAGQSLELIGPLGRGFDVPPDLSRAYLVGGGVGMAPLIALAESLAPPTEVTLFYGERNKNYIPHPDFFQNFPGAIQVCTDDGSAGQAGLVTGPLTKALARQPAMIFACGPRPMLSALAGLARQYQVEAQFSMEAHMACGLGACLGCVLETTDPHRVYARVCQEGPVFRAEEVKW